MMKKLFYLYLVFTFLSCSFSTTELEEELKRNMVENFAKNDSGSEIELLDFKLVHKGGNEYNGFLDLAISSRKPYSLNYSTYSPVLEIERLVYEAFGQYIYEHNLKEKIKVNYSVDFTLEEIGYEKYSYKIIIDQQKLIDELFLKKLN